MTRIFYVEDEPALGKIVKESLQSRKYEVSMAEDGKSALSIFPETKADICVLDIMLPKMDGYQLAKAIRTDRTRHAHHFSHRKKSGRRCIERI
jgi:DNA-binding response OmpR family regulator